MSVRVKYGSRASTGLAFLPHYFTSHHIKASRFTFVVVMTAIDIIAQTDKTSMMVLESPGIEEINFPGCYIIARSGQL